MNILFITMTYPTPTRPRQGMFNKNLVIAMRADHDVRVIAPIPWVEQKYKFGQTVMDPESHDLHPTFYYTPKFFRRFYHAFYWQSILPTVVQLEKSFIPDLVMGYWLHPDGSAAQRVAARFASPCIVFSGGSDLRMLPRDPGRRRVVERVLSNADRLIVVSHDLAATAVELGMPSEKIDVVYRGVDQRCFRPGNRDQARDACKLPRDAIVVMWAGRFEAVKNPLMLLHAAASWRKKWGDRLFVLIAGDGTLRGEVQRLRSQLKLEECVRLEGNLSQDELALRYVAADLMVLTSHSEGIPNVLLESISCGLPFVATNVGGVSEIASPDIDRLVADNDLDALVEAVIQQIESPSSADREFVPDAVPDMAARFNTVFHRALSSPEPRQQEAQ